ncbi:chorismate-binding protein [Polynucleobacter sp. 15G-AUS-farblos]|uniref:chorismate-binding protein n=1 Tax=Polynucleobacter sp. 15G-AUS-farblos TaxID=2689094 RepID=UPI001C0B7A3A|nr:chorismate-binding protein [Polynucleobacter sp. 15G-AUS-farblos]MBU3583079.1 chorismate-binding protein [Polynucleobacter sp. 15G-AUS-farblos]
MILLDDAQSSPAQPSSRLYESPIQTWCVLPSGNDEQDQGAIQDCLTELDAALSKGQHLVAIFSYELGRLFQHLPKRASSTTHPLMQAWAFQSHQALSKDQVDALIANKLFQLSDEERIAGVLDVTESITNVQFSQDIAKIQEYIRSGDTYQINHTYRITGQTYGSPLALYSRLRERQPGRFGAYIKQDRQFILSQSPELFIQKNGAILKAMPMKGTASALSSGASALSEDPKNQAENVMIVDLLRNDLSRISLPGTVQVPKLFEVARHGDVLQMTSTVQGEIKPKTSLYAILQAVFPCGSVTGAPKKRSMEIIQELEPFDRGYYCGALGWLDPNGDFAFSVPIRTVEIEENAQSQSSHFTLGIGAGITIDSDAQQEWEECQIKAAFLKELPSSTGLFETIAVIEGLPQRVTAHLDRIESSARSLSIPFQRKDAEQHLSMFCSSLDPHQIFRVRFDLSNTGQMSCSSGVLESLEQPVKIFWAKDILPSNTVMFSGDPLLQHKVSKRHLYDAAWKAAVQLGGFDALFNNEQGFVTEGGRTSIFIRLPNSDEWLTPPVSAGLLPGVMRAALLTNPQMNAREANLTIKDVSMASEIMLSNALRGAIKAQF